MTTPGLISVGLIGAGRMGSFHAETLACRQIGALAARTSVAPQGLFHRAGDRVLDWDIRRAPQVLGEPGVLDAFGALGSPTGLAGMAGTRR